MVVDLRYKIIHNPRQEIKQNKLSINSIRKAHRKLHIVNIVTVHKDSL